MALSSPITAAFGEDPVLFVDCDDTLVRWAGNATEPHPYGRGALVDPLSNLPIWSWNDDVVALINYWPGHVVVWSGGGVSYASGWAYGLQEEGRLVPDKAVDPWLHVIEKHPAFPRAQDLILDDDSNRPGAMWEFSYGRVIHPLKLREELPDTFAPAGADQEGVV